MVAAVPPESLICVVASSEKMELVTLSSAPLVTVAPLRAVLKSRAYVSPVPFVKVMLPMAAAISGPTSFKKLPVAFWEAICAGAVAADVDAVVSEVLDVITAVAAAESNATPPTSIEKSRDTDVPAVDKAEMLSKATPLITMPLMLEEPAVVPPTNVVSHVKSKVEAPARTVQAAVLPVSTEGETATVPAVNTAAFARVEIPDVTNFAPVTLTEPVKTELVFWPKRMNNRLVRVAVAIDGTDGKA